MKEFWENNLVEIAAYYSVSVLCLVIFLSVFELVTTYKNWEEIQKGNMAVAMATGGKILGIANVLQKSISQHNSLLQMMGWGLFGFILLLIGYFISTNDRPTEITNEMKPTARLSFSISLSILKRGVRNSKMK